MLPDYHFSEDLATVECSYCVWDCLHCPYADVCYKSALPA